METVLLAKTEARELGKRVRGGLTAEQRAMKSAMIVEYCRNELDWKSYKLVHLFVPIERLNEIDTWPLLSWIWRTYPSIRTFVPRLAANGIEHVEVTKQTHFGPNALGIPEPMTGKLLPEHRPLDLVLMPLLAFDSDKVEFMATFGTSACHLDLSQIRFEVAEREADLLTECEAALSDLLVLAQADPDRFVRTLHPPISSSGLSLSVYTISGGKYGSKPGH